MMLGEVLTYDADKVERQFADIMHREGMRQVMVASTRLVGTITEMTRVMTLAGHAIRTFATTVRVYGDKPTRPLIHNGGRPRR